MPGFNGDSRVEFAIVWRDGCEDLVQVEVKLVSESWRGALHAYARSSGIKAFGEALAELAAGSGTACTFRSISREQDPDIVVQVGEADRAGHLACRLELRERQRHFQGHHHASQLFHTVNTEATFVDRFARELLRLAAEQRGRAVLIAE